MVEMPTFMLFEVDENCNVHIATTPPAAAVVSAVSVSYPSYPEDSNRLKATKIMMI